MGTISVVRVLCGGSCSFSSFGPYEISVLIQTSLGHLRRPFPDGARPSQTLHLTLVSCTSQSLIGTNFRKILRCCVHGP